MNTTSSGQTSSMGPMIIHITAVETVDVIMSATSCTSPINDLSEAIPVAPE